MLNTNSLGSASIFAACHETMMISEFCMKITVANSDRRRGLLEVIRPSFAALRWIATERFDPTSILPVIAELEAKVEELVNLPLKFVDDQNPQSDRCPACGGALTAIEDSDTYCCSPCHDLVWPTLVRLESIDEGFAIDCI
jgi:hypothetical protein